MHLPNNHRKPFLFSLQDITEQDIHKEIDKLATHVKKFPKFIAKHLKGYLKKQVSNFQAGQVSKFSHEWSKITLLTLIF